MNATQLTKGAILQNGKYRIERVLGQGGFGITYLATQDILERKVAVKEFFMRDFCTREGDTSTVSLGSTANRETMERYMAKFLKEARIISELNHPNIIRIYDIFRENNTAYYVMEYIEGCTLEEYVEQTETRTLKEEEALKIISQVASALDIMHQNHMNHLDVKPSNIMIDEDNDNRAVLIDFGSAHLFREDKTNETSLLLVHSRGFTPPEIQGVRDFSPTVDVYSLGATLYYILVGDTPSATNDQQNEACPDDISDTTWRAISKSIRLNPAERPQSISEFMELLNI